MKGFQEGKERDKKGKERVKVDELNGLGEKGKRLRRISKGLKRERKGLME